MNPKFLFWLCAVMATGNLALGGWLIANGESGWGSVGFGAFWTLLAYGHARRIKG